MSLNNRTKLFLPIGLFVIMAGLLVFALTRNPNVVPSALLNKPLPEFSQPGLFAGEGPYTTEDIKGSITILNVWGSWCPPCHVEHPFLLELSGREEDVRFVGVTYDYSIEPDRDFLEERGSPFDINVVDFDGSLRIDLGVTGAPETFLIDQNGTIVHRHIGTIDFDVWDEDFAPVIALLREQAQE